MSKGGFYWHFTDRQALLEEMLDIWEKAATEDIIARVDSQPADPRATLQQLFELRVLYEVCARPGEDRAGCEIVAWQFTDLAELGITEEQATDAV